MTSSSAINIFNVLSSARESGITHETFPWYAVRTRSNQEWVVATILESKGYESYLPVCRQRRRWSDRVVNTDVPLFPGYVFCRFDHERRLPIISTMGVVCIIGCGHNPEPIPDSEIQAIGAVLRSGLSAEPHPFLHVGQRVRISHGSLKDLEGILIRKKSAWRLVVSVSILQRSVAVEIDHSCISTN
jgi:transcription antitermination factor NusG